MNSATEWKVAALRFTAFLVNAHLSAEELWESVIGSKPDTQITERTTQVFRSSLNHGNIILNAKPKIINWLFQIEDADSSIDTLENLSDSLSIFLPYIKKWLTWDECQEFRRIALGGILLIPQPDKIHGYETLTSRYLKFNPDLENASDFFYQINRPRNSARLEGLTINRLTKWGVANVRSIQVYPVLEDSEESTRIRLELDINTSNDFQGTLTCKTSLDLLDELVDLAKEIAQDGDVP